jgi:hypothetical protein
MDGPQLGLNELELLTCKS